MDISDISELERLEGLATPGPWFVVELDDELCMGAVAISNEQLPDTRLSMRSATWPSEKIVAVCLLQAPPYALIHDDKFQENADLIAAMRRHLPELLQLGRKMLEDAA